MYAMDLRTRSDIAHAIVVVSHFLSNPNNDHLEAAKWILRYLGVTLGICLKFSDNRIVLHGYIDANIASVIDSMKPTSRYLMIFVKGVVSWQLRLQKCISLSTIEAKYIDATKACKEVLWLKKFLHELDLV